jgi:hypothetical protein
MPKPTVYAFVQDAPGDLLEAVKTIPKVRYGASITGRFRYFLAIESTPKALEKVIDRLSAAGATGVETLVPMGPAMLKHSKMEARAAFVSIQAEPGQAENLYDRVVQMEGVGGAALVAGTGVDIVAEVNGSTDAQLQQRVLNVNGLRGVGRSDSSLAMRQYKRPGA